MGKLKASVNLIRGNLVILSQLKISAIYYSIMKTAKQCIAYISVRWERGLYTAKLVAMRAASR